MLALSSMAPAARLGRGGQSPEDCGRFQISQSHTVVPSRSCTVDDSEGLDMRIRKSMNSIAKSLASNGISKDFRFFFSLLFVLASCPKLDPTKLNVHLIAHTHNDVGWLKTVDQYYYGGHTLTQKAGVQYILDSVIQELKNDPQKRFIYVETAFFWKWWMDQHDFVKHSVRNLVNSGQLEFIGGGWSMNDEATTNYQSIIDQFTWGLRKLNESFGECARPHVGWQIDPFGHSRETASLFAQLGYDGLFIGRLDFQDKQQRFRTKTTEMIWEGSDNLGSSANLFTNVLFNNYAPPPGFCFDILCTDEPIIDDDRSPEYNVPRRASQFIKYIKHQVQFYRSNNTILTMGGDFTYQDTHMWFKNLDKLVREHLGKQRHCSTLAPGNIWANKGVVKLPLQGTFGKTKTLNACSREHLGKQRRSTPAPGNIWANKDVQCSRQGTFGQIKALFNACFREHLGK
uniref:Glycoside hydrolase family 38 N-terminal domain-containing protein n=2 Tax=Timema TaxID=61471 RepID=A0A7R9EEQ3_9NEOP|nr:unnamed protein product [Timema monikensis]